MSATTTCTLQNKHGESWFRCHRHQNHDSNFSLAGPTWGTITLIPEPWSIRGSAECNKSKDEQTATEKTIGCTAATSLAGVLFFHGNLSPWSFFSSRFGNTTLDYVVKSAIMSLCRLKVFLDWGCQDDYLYRLGFQKINGDNVFLKFISWGNAQHCSTCWANSPTEAWLLGDLRGGLVPMEVSWLVSCVWAFKHQRRSHTLSQSAVIDDSNAKGLNF